MIGVTGPRLRRRAVAGLFITVAAASGITAAHAGDDPWSRAWTPGDARRAVVEASDADGPAAAAALVARLAAPGVQRNRARDVEAARAAFDVLPSEHGVPAAAKVLAAALAADPSDAGGAWTLAQDVRRDVIARADVAAGEPLLRTLVTIYPDGAVYRYDLGRLFRDAARRADARAEFEKAFKAAPSSFGAAYRLAEMAEQDGDARGAIAIYDQILSTRPTEFPAIGAKASVIELLMRDEPAGRAVLEAGIRLAESAPDGPERTRALADFAERRHLMEQRAKNRRAIRAVDDRVTMLLWAAAAASVVGAALLLAWVSRLRPPAAGDTPGNPSA